MPTTASEKLEAPANHGRLDADAQALRHLTMLILAGLACTICILAFLILAAMQAVAIIDTSSRDHERLQVERAVAAAPGGMNEITLDAMASTLDLDHARLTTLAEVSPAELSVGIGGDNVVAWVPHLVGSRTFGIVAPARIVAGAIFVLIVGLIGWRVHIVGRRLDRRRATAAQLAVTDSLTGLSNRMAFDAELDRRVAAGPAIPDFALLLADLDDFKAINDSHGHGVGDQVLQTIAQRLRDVVQPGDLVARIGGDEFALICAASRLNETLAELRRRVAAPLEIDGRVLAISASLGVARRHDFPGTSATLTQAADSALYRAKRAGPGNAELAIPMPLPRRYAA